MVAFPACPEKFTPDNVVTPFSKLSVVTVTLPAPRNNLNRVGWRGHSQTLRIRPRTSPSQTEPEGVSVAVGGVTSGAVRAVINKSLLAFQSVAQ